MTKKEIQVLFVDKQTGKPFVQSLMPVESLPKTFELRTTMHIGQEDWRVLNAEPLTAEEFKQTGKLVLTLEKVTKVSARDILYTLPTICEEIPPIRKNIFKKTDNLFRIHEDDWRQIELVAAHYQNEIAAEFSAIDDIFRDHKVGIGFNKTHIRERIKTPILENITPNHILSVFPVATRKFDGSSYLKAGDFIQGGFAFELSPIIIYGQEERGIIKALGLKKSENNIVSSSDISLALNKIMKEHALYLVDWCRLQLITSEIAHIQSYLESNFYG